VPVTIANIGVSSLSALWKIASKGLFEMDMGM